MLEWARQSGPSNKCQTRLAMTPPPFPFAAGTHLGRPCMPVPPILWRRCLLRKRRVRETKEMHYYYIHVGKVACPIIHCPLNYWSTNFWQNNFFFVARYDNNVSIYYFKTNQTRGSNPIIKKMIKRNWKPARRQLLNSRRMFYLELETKWNRSRLAPLMCSSDNLKHPKHFK